MFLLVFLWGWGVIGPVTDAWGQETEGHATTDQGLDHGGKKWWGHDDNEENDGDNVEVILAR